MRKLVPFIVVIALLLAPATVFAKSSKSVYVEWSWQGDKSAYFYPTPSGLVQAWTFDHLTLGDSHWVIKPLDKFTNATMCDEGYIHMNANWTPWGIWNAADAENKAVFVEIFPDLNQEYLLCVYPVE